MFALQLDYEDENMKYVWIYNRWNLMKGKMNWEFISWNTTLQNVLDMNNMNMKCL